jgi:hypothetical protein
MPLLLSDRVAFLVEGQEDALAFKNLVVLGTGEEADVSACGRLGFDRDFDGDDRVALGA